ncbi:UNVERIFIED_CONTAM: hypothetical protein K2H54_014042 [Gekko kuhli]
MGMVLNKNRNFGHQSTSEGEETGKKPLSPSTLPDLLKPDLIQGAAVLLKDMFREKCEEELQKLISETTSSRCPASPSRGTSVSGMASVFAEDIISELLSGLLSAIRKIYSDTLSKTDFAGKQVLLDPAFWRSCIPQSQEALSQRPKKTLLIMRRKIKAFATRGRRTLQALLGSRTISEAQSGPPEAVPTTAPRLLGKGRKGKASMNTSLPGMAVYTDEEEENREGNEAFSATATSCPLQLALKKIEGAFQELPLCDLQRYAKKVSRTILQSGEGGCSLCNIL